ncbi:hypothetical protein BKA61DRAFT_584991 [Leptodontidium sp. MPI-SDFR-AT-0119]|nr:hypothetical protein BKA61DRAFT_584991 [Leptodontidium sp. MPI-SDFR-AT-0119]
MNLWLKFRHHYQDPAPNLNNTSILYNHFRIRASTLARTAVFVLSSIHRNITIYQPPLLHLPNQFQPQTCTAKDTRDGETGIRTTTASFRALNKLLLHHRPLCSKVLVLLTPISKLLKLENVFQPVDSTPTPQPTRQFGFANNRPIVDPFGATPQQPSPLTPPPSEKEKRFISIAEDDIPWQQTSTQRPVRLFTPAEWQNHLRIRDMRKVERKAKGNCKARQATFQVERMNQSEDMSDKERVEILTNNLRSKDHSIGQLRDINRGLTLERNKFERGLNNSNSDLATCRSDFAKRQEDLDQQRKGYEEAVRSIEEQLAQKQRNLASAQADSKEHSACRGKLEDAEDRCSTVNAELDECKSQLKTSLQFKKLLEEAEERCARLEKRNAELQKVATDNAKAIQLLTKRNSNQAEEFSDLRKQLEEGAQVAKGLKKELDDHAESAKSCIQDLESQLTEQLNCMGAIEAAFDKFVHQKATSAGVVESAADSTTNTGPSQSNPVGDNDSTLAEKNDEKVGSGVVSDPGAENQIAVGGGEESTTSASINTTNDDVTRPRLATNNGKASKKIVTVSFLGTIIAMLVYLAIAFCAPTPPEITHTLEFESISLQLVFTPTTCPFQGPSTSAVASIPTTTAATYNKVTPENFWVSFQQVVETPNNGSLIEDEGSETPVDEGVCDLREEFPRLRKAIFTAGVAVVIHAAFSGLSYC